MMNYLKCRIAKAKFRTKYYGWRVKLSWFVAGSMFVLAGLSVYAGLAPSNIFGGISYFVALFYALGVIVWAMTDYKSHLRKMNELYRNELNEIAIKYGRVEEIVV